MRLPISCVLALFACAALGATKPKDVGVGATRSVSLAGSGETVRVRPVVVNGRRTEWIAADIHTVTDATYVAQRMVHVNDLLPGEKGSRWTWEPGPWLQVDRRTGHATVLHLPGFDPGASRVVWFRDYAAYCGSVAASKGTEQWIVWQIGARRPALQRAIEPGGPETCPALEWQRTPLAVILHPAAGAPVTVRLQASATPREDGSDAQDQ